MRKHKDKEKAYIWDLIVLPPDIDDSSSNMERNMFVSEVKRVLNFAALADNKLDILYGELRDVCHQLNIDMFRMLDEEEEQYK